jgi:fumarate hydratase class II
MSGLPEADGLAAEWQELRVLYPLYSALAREFYGDANQYTKIVNANRNVLPDAAAIRPGQKLVIPE